MPAPATASPDEIRDVNTRYHDGAAAGYDAKWGIDYGEVGRGQVLGKVAQGARAACRSFGRSLEVGAGTGYFSLNLLQGGRGRARPSAPTSRPGMLEALEANAARLGLDVETAACDAEDAAVRRRVLRPRLRPRGPAPPARPRPRLRASSAACCAPAGRLFFAGEPSRLRRPPRGVPQARRAARSRPLWRRAMRAAPAPDGHRDGGEANHELEAFVDVHAFTPEQLAGHAARARGLRRRPRARRGAAGQLVRVGQPRARGDRRPRRRPVGVEGLRVPRLPAAAEGRPRGCSSRACRRRSSTTSCSSARRA